MTRTWIALPILLLAACETFPTCEVDFESEVDWDDDALNGESAETVLQRWNDRLGTPAEVLNPRRDDVTQVTATLSPGDALPVWREVFFGKRRQLWNPNDVGFFPTQCVSGLTIPVVTTVQWADDAPYDIPAAVKALESDFDDDGRRVDPDTLSASAEHQSSAWDGVSPAGADTLRTDLDSRSGTTSIALLAVGAQDVERLAGAILLEPPL